MDSTQKLIADIKQITKAQNYAVSSGRTRWPRTVKERIEILLRAGIQIDELVAQTPIPRATLYKWCKTWGLVKARRKRFVPDGKFLPVMPKNEDHLSRDTNLSRDESGQLKLRLDGVGEISGSPSLIAEMVLLLRGQQ
jgi:hypothetical protein